MSKLSHWWHGWVDGRGFSPAVTSFLHAYGLLSIWAGLIGLPIVLLVIAVVVFRHI